MPRWAVVSQRLILRGEPWSTLPREFRRWFARFIWGNVWDIHTNPCRRTAWCLALWAPACFGSDGSALTRAVRFLRELWQPVHLLPLISAPPPLRLVGRRWSGCIAARQAHWAQSPAQSPDWLRLLLPQGSWGRCLRC